MSVRLRGYTDADLELTLELETDPITMTELGGPRDRDALLRAHGRRLGEPLYFVIEDAGAPVGTIGTWKTELDGEQIDEVGWMVLPRAHGRGVATSAFAALLARLRVHASIARVHAFPAVTNVASNRLCDRFGFAQLAVRSFEFSGRELTCAHRVLDLA
jgi:RimJ/RimL family protein N-acetyltransferase